MREERVSAVLFESDMWKCDSVWGIESSVLCEVNWGRYPDTVQNRGCEQALPH